MEYEKEKTDNSYLVAPEYIECSKELEENSKEFSDCSDEFVELKPEYSVDNFEQEQEETKKQLKHHHLLRKMGYLVAAAGCVLMLADVSVVDYVQEYVEEIIEQPSQQLQETEEQQESEEQSALIESIVCQDWGVSAGNVIPMQKNGFWGALNYKGEEIVPFEYVGFYRAANAHGYFIMTNSEGENCVISPEGKVVYRTTNDVYISGTNNYILDAYATAEEMYDTEVIEYQYKYLDVEGNVLFDTGRQYYTLDEWEQFVEEYYGSDRMVLPASPKFGATPYDGDTAIVASGVTTYLLGKDGEVLKEDSDFYEDWYKVLTYDDSGYFVTSSYLGHQLRKIDNSNIGEGIYMPTEIFTALFGSDSEEQAMDGWEVEYMPEDSYVSFWDDGYHHYLNGTTMCSKGLDAEGNEKYVLYDAAKFPEDYNSKEDILRCVIAVYDQIIFDDEKYMAVRENDHWFYIDQNGKKVSEIYEDASAFAPDGYALVIMDGCAYKINDEFEIIEKYGEAEVVCNSGELLVTQNGNQQKIITPSGMLNFQIQ